MTETCISCKHHDDIEARCLANKAGICAKNNYSEWEKRDTMTKSCETCNKFTPANTETKEDEYCTECWPAVRRCLRNNHSLYEANQQSYIDVALEKIAGQWRYTRKGATPIITMAVTYEDFLGYVFDENGKEYITSSPVMWRAESSNSLWYQKERHSGNMTIEVCKAIRFKENTQ